MQFWKRSLRVWVVVIGVAAVAGATPGSFRGTIVDNPNAAKGWIYVQGRNGSARRVDVSRAKVMYDEDVPAGERRADPGAELVAGAEVRVTAEQGSDGEWHAKEIEILKSAGKATQHPAGQRATTGS